MKKIFLIATILCAALFASCSKDMPEASVGGASEGRLNITFSIPNAATRAAYSGDADVRIYQYGDSSKQDRTLVRHYLSIADVPATMWLLEGDYCVTVSIDNSDAAQPVTDGGTIYYGAADFSVTAGAVSDIEVDCRVRNTMIRVIFDKSIAEKFDVSGVDETTGVEACYGTTVVVNNGAEGWNKNYKSNGNPYYDYTAANTTADEEGNREGTAYFVLPADAERISYCFHGRTSDDSVAGTDPETGKSTAGEVHIHRTKSLPVYDGTREGVLYTLRFQYTPDPEGYIKVDFTISIEEPEVSDKVVGVNPASKPTFDGADFSVTQLHAVTGRSLSYVAKHDKAIDQITVRVDGGAEIDCLTEPEGITLERINNDTEIKVTFGEEFLNTLLGGEHTLRFSVASSGAEGIVTSKIRTQGMLSAGHDAWNSAALARTVIFAENMAQAKIEYRAKGSEAWQQYTPASEPEEDVYAESVESVEMFGADNRGKSFELRLTVDGRQTGAVVEAVASDVLPQIPNAGFETWTGTSPLLPYGNGVEQFWDTGNHGSATLSRNVTTNVADVRSDAEGQYSAKLQSQWVVLKFAAGNIFVGQYAGTDGTDGVIAFGKPFPYSYRPKALRFWYKSSNGNINRGSGAPDVSTGDPDPNEIYIMLCQMDGPHIVATKDKSTLVDVTSPTISCCTAGSYNKNSTNDKEDGKVIAYGLWNNSETQGEWTKVELELTYNPQYEGEMPNYLMLTASASKYGDYFVGCDSNALWLDDVELVY